MSFQLRDLHGLSENSAFPFIIHLYSLCTVCVCVSLCLPFPYYHYQPGRHSTSGEGPRYGVIKASEGRERERERERVLTLGVCMCAQSEDFLCARACGGGRIWTEIQI